MKLLVLAVDTTHEFGSVALTRGTETVEERELHAPGGFAHVIYGELRRLLERHSLRLEEVECFAAASGPGSFTGVRVGLACIKGLAEACGRAAVGVSNLRAMASFGSLPVRAVLLDARRGEVYGGVYDAAGTALLPETVSSPRAWLEALPEAEIEFIGMDLTFGEALAASRFAHAPRITAPRALAAAIGRIAAGSLARGEACDPAALDANYVRRSDAELFWKE